MESPWPVDRRRLKECLNGYKDGEPRNEDASENAAEALGMVRTDPTLAPSLAPAAIVAPLDPPNAS